MLKIGHTADNHLRATQYSYSSRAMDFHKSLDFIIHDAAHRKLDALIISGDIIDTTRPTSYTIALLQHLHATAKALKVRILLTSGNHDKTEPHWSSILEQDPEFGIQLVDNKEFTISNGSETLRGLGLPYMSDEDLLNRLEGITTPYDIIVWHGMIGNFDGVRPDALDASIFSGKAKNVLLGDIHIRQYLYLEEHKLFIGYPGSSELGRTSEPLEKSYEVVSMEPGSPALDFEPIIIPTRMAFVRILHTQGDLDELIHDLRENSDSKPMVFVKHDASLENVRGRIVASLPEQSIISVQRLPKSVNIMNSIDFDEDTTLAHFIGDFFPAGSQLYGAAEKLLQENVKVEDVLDELIAQRTQHHESTQSKNN